MHLGCSRCMQPPERRSPGRLAGCVVIYSNFFCGFGSPPRPPSSVRAVSRRGAWQGLPPPPPSPPPAAGPYPAGTPGSAVFVVVVLRGKEAVERGGERRGGGGGGGVVAFRLASLPLRPVCPASLLPLGGAAAGGSAEGRRRCGSTWSRWRRGRAAVGGPWAPSSSSSFSSLDSASGTGTCGQDRGGPPPSAGRLGRAGQGSAARRGGSCPPRPGPAPPRCLLLGEGRGGRGTGALHNRGR